MAEILIVNPSVNMRLSAMEMKMYGNTIRFAYTTDYHTADSRRIFYFFTKNNICFTTDNQGEVVRDDRIFLFSKNIFSRIKMMNYKKDFANYYSDIRSVTYKDLVLFERNTLSYEEKHETEGSLIYKSFDDIVKNNSNSIIFTNILYGQSGSNNEKMCFWETDFDIESTFSTDYFVFFTDGKRLEVYADGSKLITIGRGSNHIDILNKVIPALKKFSFSSAGSIDIYRSLSPWIHHIGNTRTYLINDYSFGRLSISMPSAWYDKLAHFINNHISRKYKNKI